MTADIVEQGYERPDAQTLRIYRRWSDGATTVELRTLHEDGLWWFGESRPVDIPTTVVMTGVGAAGLGG